MLEKKTTDLLPYLLSKLLGFINGSTSFPLFKIKSQVSSSYRLLHLNLSRTAPSFHQCYLFLSLENRITSQDSSPTTQVLALLLTRMCLILQNMVRKAPQ